MVCEFDSKSMHMTYLAPILRLLQSDNGNLLQLDFWSSFSPLKCLFNKFLFFLNSANIPSGFSSIIYFLHMKSITDPEKRK